MRCATCGTEKTYQGIVCPARLFCACEQARCSKCKAFAIGVEFTKPIKDIEPPIDNKKEATLFCAEHAPDGFVIASTGDEKKSWKTKAESSGEVVACITCKKTAALSQRKNWNGTHSECPFCGEGIHVHAGDYDDKTLGYTPEQLQQLAARKRESLFCGRTVRPPKTKTSIKRGIPVVVEASAAETATSLPLSKEAIERQRYKERSGKGLFANQYKNEQKPS